ncbi:uncharacterized protein TNCV_1062091 [Trichonephila clavipes]|nr:uncharacterized protein TNCV_1062091 [Trichonephila clavipes]
MVPQINTRGDSVLCTMAPYTIKPAVEAVCCCKAKAGLRRSPRARRIRILRGHTEVPSEGASCAWMAADEALSCTRSFLMMWQTSRGLACEGCPVPVLRVNDISPIHWSQHLVMYFPLEVHPSKYQRKLEV